MIKFAHKTKHQKEEIIMMKSKVTKMGIAMILIVAMLMSLAGCSKRSSSSSNNVSSNNTALNSNYTNSNTSSVKTNQGGSNYGNSGNVNVSYEKTLCSRCDGLGVCPECFGEGEFHCDSYCIGGRCTYCSDNGKILVDFDSKGNPKYRNCPYCYNGSCKKCNGTGSIDCRYCIDGTCPSCNGTGYI